MLRKPPKTPSEKANRATLRIIARLAGCAYLLYILYQLIKNTNTEDSGMSMPVVIIISAVIIIVSLILIVLTVMDFINGLKNHDYSMHKYYQEELDARGLEYNEDGELVPKGTAAAAEKEALDGAASEAEYEEDDNDYEDGDEEDDTSNDGED